MKFQVRISLGTAVLLTAGLAQTTPAASTAKLLFVDDDGAQYPGALKTIQEAVAQAAPGATILVCPGTYRKSVKLTGDSSAGIHLIALGHDDEVVIAGDHTEAYGILLKDVSNVLVRGFTIHAFGDKPTTASQFGWGCGVHLENAHYCIIENNRISKTDMTGITVFGSANNTVRYNFIYEIDPKGFGQGIWINGKTATNNMIFQNYAYLQDGAGMVVWQAGEGNVILDNNFSNNGQWGITHRGTNGTTIEGNRFSYNAGANGAITTENDRRSIGIELRNSDNVTVNGNMARGNTRFDISWDAKGVVSFSNNACDTADQPGLCVK